MPIRFSRNVVIPIWFAVFALIAIVGPHLNVFGSVLFITAGLTVPAIALVLWHDPPVPVALVPGRGDSTRKSPRTTQM